MRKIIFTLVAMLAMLPAVSHAAGYLLADPANQTAQGISGANAGGFSEVISVTGGALHVTSTGSIALDPTNGQVDIPAAGVADRVQMTTLTSTSCTLQAPAGNADVIYVGDSTVTNSSGANEGIELIPGSGLSNIDVSNLNLLYVAADSAGDDVKYICN